MLSKKLKHIRRKERTRFKLKSSNFDRLRLCFYTSNKYIYGQVIDESKRMTITSLATYDKDFKDYLPFEEMALWKYPDRNFFCGIAFSLKPDLANAYYDNCMN